MKIYVGEVFETAFRIMWKHKKLWLWQILPSLAFIFLLPVVILYHSAFTRLVYGTRLQIPVDPWKQLITASNLLFLTSFFLLWVLAQIITVRRINAIENRENQISFIESLKKSLNYYWRVSGVYLAFLGVCAIFILIPQPIFLFIFRIFPTNGVYFAFPLTVIIIPVLVINACLTQFALIAIIINNLNFRVALRQGWHFLRANGWSVILIFIVLYFGCNFFFALFFMPILFMSVFSTLYLTRLPDPNVILFIVFFMMLPFLMCVFMFTIGVIMTFIQSVWTVLYIRISHLNELNFDGF